MTLIKYIYLFTFTLVVSLAHAQIFNAAEIRMYWKNNSGKPFTTFDNVISEHPKVRFLMNAGMYTTTFYPVGLYIENGKQHRPLKIIVNPRVNYGIPPSGVFYITKKGAFIVQVNRQSTFPDAIYATQSGPMLVIDGKMNKNLPKGRFIIRNGVGIRKDGKVVFACLQMDFHAFAEYFIKQGCTTALFLDGGISQIWEKGSYTGWGEFGPMIGVE